MIGYQTENHTDQCPDSGVTLAFPKKREKDKMFTYVKSLVSRVVLGPSDKDNQLQQKENGNNRDMWSDEDTRDMIQLINFTSGDPGLDIFVEVGTVEQEDNTAEESDEAEEVTEETSKNEETASDRENSWKLSEDDFMRRKRVRRMSPVNENVVETEKDVVAEEPAAKEEIGLDKPESIRSRPTKLEVASGPSDILILSSPDDPDSSPSPSPESAAAGQSPSPISDSDPVAELFPIKVKRSFTLRPTLRSVNR